MADDDKITETATAPAKTEDLPEWARKAISEANAEAAKYRTRAHETEAAVTARLNTEWEAKLKGAVEETSAARSERDKALLGQTKLDVALAAGVSSDKAKDFADLLQGSNTEELTAYAQKVLQFGGGSKPVKAVDPTQGLQGGAAGDAIDQAFAQLFKKNLTPR